MYKNCKLKNFYYISITNTLALQINKKHVLWHVINKNNNNKKRKTEIVFHGHVCGNCTANIGYLQYIDNDVITKMDVHICQSSHFKNASIEHKMEIIFDVELPTFL